jgi:hypothetical protein
MRTLENLFGKRRGTKEEYIWYSNFLGSSAKSNYEKIVIQQFFKKQLLTHGKYTIEPHRDWHHQN